MFCANSTLYGRHIVIDNFFGSVALLEELSQKKITATCTLREDRLSGAPLRPRKVLEKEERGTSDEAFISCISVVKWKDNEVVSVASNKFRSDPAKKRNGGIELTRNTLKLTYRSQSTFITSTWVEWTYLNNK